MLERYSSTLSSLLQERLAQHRRVGAIGRLFLFVLEYISTILMCQIPVLAAFTLRKSEGRE